MACLYLYRSTTLSLLGVDTHMTTPEEEPLFFLLLHSFLLYLAVDLVWISLAPNCIPNSVLSIAVHHVVSMIMCGLSYAHPSLFAWLTCATLLVEFNTICLVCRRNLRFDSLGYRCMNTLFYASWVVQRLVMLPVLAYWDLWEWLAFSEAAGTYLNEALIGPLGGIFLVLISYFWTAQLLFKANRFGGAEKGERKDE